MTVEPWDPGVNSQIANKQTIVFLLHNLTMVRDEVNWEPAFLTTDWHSGPLMNTNIHQLKTSQIILLYTSEYNIRQSHTDITRGYALLGFAHSCIINFSVFNFNKGVLLNPFFFALEFYNSFKSISLNQLVTQRLRILTCPESIEVSAFILRVFFSTSFIKRKLEKP